MPVINSANNMLLHSKKNELSRRHSFSEGCNLVFQDKLIKVENSPLNLERSKIISNLALLNGSDGIVEIKYKHSGLEQIDAKNYVYCGSAAIFPINSTGISIDKNGDLILIKGNSYDLCKGLFKKYTSGYRYKTSRLNIDNLDKKFESLYMDDDGMLIGVEQKTGKNFIIRMSIPEIEGNIHGQFVKLEFTECNLRKPCDDLTFSIDNEHTASYFTKSNKLYLKTLSHVGRNKDYSFFLYEIDIPLRPGYVLSNIKKTMGALQLEIHCGNKRRILYVDPKHISTHDLKVKKTSHKPPQNFTSRIGNDPHEKYHAGLPFSSDRKNNFSSKHIPLFSSIIDNFRVHIKKAKEYSAEKNQTKAIISGLKSIDPFVGGITATAPILIGAATSMSGRNIDSKEKLYKKNKDILKSHSKPLSKLAKDALGVNHNQNISDSLICLVNEIKVKDTLHLTSTDRIATFFGIASGGVPFVPGWFAGIVLELSKSHDLIIEKKEINHLKVSFINRHKTAVTALAGTGQGLEKTLLHTSGVDYMTVLPVEANAIITAQSVLGDNFSFDMKEEHFSEFAKQFSIPQEKLSLQNILTEAQVEKIKDKEFCIKVEAKSELRLQEGSMINTSTYMVMPRTAVGLRLALDLLNIKSNKSDRMDKNEQSFSPAKKNFKITALDYDTALFAEWKVMPIAMSGGGENTLWCYPLPLLEEGKTIAENKKENVLVLLNKSLVSECPQHINNYVTLAADIESIMKIPVLITIDDNNNIKKGLELKKAAKVDEYLSGISSNLIEFQRYLINMERNSQHKSSKAKVIAHYEPIATPSFLMVKRMDIPLTTRSLSKANGLRLKKLEFRRVSSLNHKKATLPMPIISCSNEHSITHNQFIGEIEFQYNSNDDILIVNTKNKLKILY